MRTEQTFGFLLKQTMQRVTNAFADTLQTACASLGKPYMITPPQLFALALLASDQDLPIGTLAQRMVLDASVVTGIIRRLEQQPCNIGEREMVPIRRRDVRSGGASH